jgi:hypothetical protein
MNLSQLKAAFKKQGCQKIYAKTLSPNDNSKNQVYLGGSFDILNIFPISEIIADSSGDWKRDRFKASVNFSWLQDDGNSYPAPKSQLILYPKYPEVRFSGFLSRCEKPPSDLMTIRQAGRILFLSDNDKGEIIGYVAAHNSELAKEFAELKNQEEIGVFKIISVSRQVADNKKELIGELKRIHDLGWIDSKRLDNKGNVLECKSSNCGGYTLEAELGITPNGYSEPDFLGWEIKQYGVKKFKLLHSSVITLMTPEPNGGIYKEDGVETFLRGYGYEDQRGREDRINFGGVHRVGEKHKRTELTLNLIGFDIESSKIKNTNGSIALLDSEENITASWSFSSLLKHWNKKHNQACYVPSLSEVKPKRKYRYGDEILLGIGTDFQLFLGEMAKGNIYYDPGIKMESASTKPKIKRRSQFRMKSGNLKNLYKTNETINLNEERKRR